MSRTPEKLIDKKAEGIQGSFYGVALILALISWGAFSKDATGGGLLFAGGSVLLFWIGSKIKTTYHQTGGIYK